MLFSQLTQILDPEPHPASLNMALDESLLVHVSEPMLRVYQWNSPAVSFGYFGRHSPVATAWPGREIVRRMTGGGIVPHGADITYTLVIPTSHLLADVNASKSYRLVHAALADWLVGCGLEATLAGRQPTRNGGVCFENAAEADVLDGVRKVAGAAQRRTRAGLLHQGSIQGVPVDWREQLPWALADRIATRDFSSAETRLAGELAAQKYGSAEWNLRIL